MSGATTVLNTAGRLAYQLAFQISPIIFINGIASDTYGIMPIAILMDTYALLNQAISGALTSTSALPTSLDDFFAHFTPIPGGRIANYAIGQYPFANQSVAANAIIAEPLSVSLRMNIPVRGAGGYVSKFQTMMNLQQAVAKHASMGGTYNVVTPSFVYTNCILTGLTDVSQGGPTPQNAWQWDFVQPLITLEQAQTAGQKNSQLSQIENGVATNGGLNPPSFAGVIPNTLSSVLPYGNLIPSAITGSSLAGAL